MLFPYSFNGIRFSHPSHLSRRQQHLRILALRSHRYLLSLSLPRLITSNHSSPHFIAPNHICTSLVPFVGSSLISQRHSSLRYHLSSLYILNRLQGFHTDLTLFKQSVGQKSRIAAKKRARDLERSKLPKFDMDMLNVLFPSTLPYIGNESYWNSIAQPVFDDWYSQYHDSFQASIHALNEIINSGISRHSEALSALNSVNDVTNIVPISHLINEFGGVDLNYRDNSLDSLYNDINNKVEYINGLINKLYKGFTDVNPRGIPTDPDLWRRLKVVSDWSNGLNEAFHSNGLFHFANLKIEELKAQIPSYTHIFELEGQIARTYLSRLDIWYNNIHIVGKLLNDTILFDITVGDSTFTYSVNEANIFINNALNTALNINSELHRAIGSVNIASNPIKVDAFDSINLAYDMPLLEHLNRILHGIENTRSMRIPKDIRIQLEVEDYMRSFTSKALINSAQFPLLAELYKDCRAVTRDSNFTKVKLSEQDYIDLIFFAISIISRTLFRQLDVDENLFDKARGLTSSIMINWTKLSGEIGEYHDKYHAFIDKSAQMILGSYILTLLCRTRFFNQEFIDKRFCLVPTNEFLNNIANFAVIGYENLPMVTKPNSWINQYHGGFLSNKDTNLVHFSPISRHQTRANSTYLAGIDKLNSTKFRINSDLLAFMQTDKGLQILEGVLNIGSDQQKAGLKLLAKFSLNIARLYSNIDYPIYLPVFADFRGRIYPNCSFLSYQGNQLTASLLELFEGEALSDQGVYYLLIYGANVYGLDKLSFDARYNWAIENAGNILNMDLDFITKAADVISFTNFALNFRKWYINPTAKLNIIINQDATCSGLQHIASILADRNLGAQVNLTGAADNANDVYQDVANKLSEIELPGKLQHLKITRDLVKRPVMTLPYGVTKRGMVDQIIDKAFAKIKIDGGYTYLFSAKDNIPSGIADKNNRIALTGAEIYELVSYLWDVINTSYIAIYELKLAVQGLTNIMTSLKIPVAWKAPSGLHITQQYLESEESRVVTSHFRRRINHVTHNFIPGTFNANKQANSIMPNFVHSLDSSLVVKLLLNTNFNLITIHDCFGCHPNRMGELRSTLFRTFADMYLTKNYLLEFYEFNIRHLEEAGIIINRDGDRIFFEHPETEEIIDIPNIPKMGNKEFLNNLKNSIPDHVYLIR